MKLSAVVLLSVNLVAAAQCAVQASDTDTAAFLKESLSATGVSSQASAQTKSVSRKVAMSSDVGMRRNSRKQSKKLTAMAPIFDNGVKIRPFVPGRYLPTEAELANAQAPAMLSGQVSDYASLQVQPQKSVREDYIDKIAQLTVRKAKDAAIKFTKSAPRAVPGIMPVLPGQVAQLPGNTSIVPQIPNPETAQVVVPQPSQSRTAFNNGPALPPLPMLSTYEQAQLNRVVETNMPENCYAQGSNGDMRALGQGNPGLAGVGPPPFPLSVLPGGKARGTMRSASMCQQPLSCQARFGSWHGGTSGLQQAAFHSYVANRINGPLNVSRVPYGNHNSAKTGRQSVTYGHKYSANHHVHVASKPHHQRKAAPYVATYSPYARYSG